MLSRVLLPRALTTCFCSLRSKGGEDALVYGCQCPWLTQGWSSEKHLGRFQVVGNQQWDPPGSPRFRGGGRLMGQEGGVQGAAARMGGDLLGRLILVSPSGEGTSVRFRTVQMPVSI